MSDIVKTGADIQQDPVQPVGNPPLSQATLTSHLKNFNPPKQTDAEIEADELADDLDGFKLPKTLKAAHELLTAIQSGQPADAAAFKVKTAKLGLLMAHISKLGEGVQPAEIGTDARKSITSAQSAGADALKLDLLSRSHPEVKALLEKTAALEKQILELKNKTQ
jgi:hypothetical protein